MYKAIIKSELLVDNNHKMWHYQYKKIKLFGIPLKVEEIYSDEQSYLELHSSSSLDINQGDKIGFKICSKIDQEETIEE